MTHDEYDDVNNINNNDQKENQSNHNNKINDILSSISILLNDNDNQEITNTEQKVQLQLLLQVFLCCIYL